MAIEATGYRPADGRRTRCSQSALSQPTSRPMTRPMPSSSTTRTAASSAPKSGCLMASMQPITSRIATGSLRPDSPSSVRARRRRSVEPRSTANTAAASVAATVEPSSSACSGSRSRIAAAATAVSAAVSSVPSVARITAVGSTGRISSKPLERPPSNRIIATATMPAERASSKSSNAIQPRPSEPMSMPRPSTSTRPGRRRRPAAREAARPAASRRPVNRRS